MNQITPFKISLDDLCCRAFSTTSAHLTEFEEQIGKHMSKSVKWGRPKPEDNSDRLSVNHTTPPEVMEWQKEVMLAAHRAGMSNIAIAQKYRVSTVTVRARLASAGVVSQTIEERAATHRIKLTPAAMDLRRNGASITSIANALGISQGLAKRIVQEAS